MTRHTVGMSIGLTLVGALTLAAQTGRSSIGREVSVPIHLRDGQELSLPLADLLAQARLLFDANWTNQEGGGRPLTKGTGRPLADPSQPLTGTRDYRKH
jgi:hypothetical protein